MCLLCVSSGCCCLMCALCFEDVDFTNANHVIINFVGLICFGVVVVVLGGFLLAKCNGDYAMVALGM